MYYPEKEDIDKFVEDLVEYDIDKDKRNTHIERERIRKRRGELYGLGGEIDMSDDEMYVPTNWDFTERIYGGGKSALEYIINKLNGSYGDIVFKILETHPVLKELYDNPKYMRRISNAMEKSGYMERKQFKKYINTLFYERAGYHHLIEKRISEDRFDSAMSVLKKHKCMLESNYDRLDSIIDCLADKDGQSEELEKLRNEVDKMKVRSKMLFLLGVGYRDLGMTRDIYAIFAEPAKTVDLDKRIKEDKDAQMKILEGCMESPRYGFLGRCLIPEGKRIDEFVKIDAEVKNDFIREKFKEFENHTNKKGVIKLYCDIISKISSPEEADQIIEKFNEVLLGDDEGEKLKKQVKGFFNGIRNDSKDNLRGKSKYEETKSYIDEETKSSIDEHGEERSSRESFRSRFNARKSALKTMLTQNKDRSDRGPSF